MKSIRRKRKSLPATCAGGPAHGSSLPGSDCTAIPSLETIFSRPAARRINPGYGAHSIERPRGSRPRSRAQRSITMSSAQAKHSSALPASLNCRRHQATCASRSSSVRLGS